jgi:hypothetical protein
MRTAKQMGWKTVLVGLKSRKDGSPIDCPEADYAVERMMDLEHAVPGLFVKDPKHLQESVRTVGGTRHSVLLKRKLSDPSLEAKPEVVFVLGGPGSGKGTQVGFLCEILGGFFCF